MLNWLPMRLVISILFLAVSIAAQTARVTHVSDGDSFILASGERVRMIGINAPELADKFGPESKEHLAHLIRGKTVALERDPENDDRDVHGRLLRFVSVDGLDINRQMIADGWAYAFLRYRFARERRDAFQQAESAARSAQIGVWSAQTGRARSDETARPSPTVPIAENKDPAHDPSYSSVIKWVVLGGVLILALVFAFRFARR